MARVHLGRLEAEQGELPPLCLRCGALAVVYKARRLAWQPVWTIILFGVTLWPLLVVSLIIRKRMSVLVPFCSVHRNHWLWRGLLALLAYGALAALVFLDYLFVLAAQEPGQRETSRCTPSSRSSKARPFFRFHPAMARDCGPTPRQWHSGPSAVSRS